MAQVMCFKCDMCKKLAESGKLATFTLVTMLGVDSVKHNTYAYEVCSGKCGRDAQARMYASLIDATFATAGNFGYKVDVHIQMEKPNG